MLDASSRRRAINSALRPSPAGPWIIDDPTAQRFKVNREVFTNPEILALERERVLDRCWLYLGHESEVETPESFVTRRVAGRPLIFLRDRDGVMRCFFNTCTHRGALICLEPKGKANQFSCPYHGWTFGANGELKAVPGATSYVDNFAADPALSLHPVRMASYRGFVFVNYDPDACELLQYLSDATELLDLFSDHGENGLEVVRGSNEYSIHANWKLLLENSIDAYHALATHGSYFDYLRARDGGLVMRSEAGEQQYSPRTSEGPVRDMGNGHVGYETVGPWGRPVARWVPGWGEALRHEIDRVYQRLVERLGSERANRIALHDRNNALFPNLVMHDNLGLTIRTFYPVSVGMMEVNAWCLAPKGEPAELRALRLRNFVEFLGPGGLSTPDDAEVLESCQRGYANQIGVQWNDVSKGMPTESSYPNKADELQMRIFWRRWNAMMFSNR